MTTFAVEYEYDDRDDRRGEHRPAHRAFLARLAETGVLLASGPYTDERHVVGHGGAAEGGTAGGSPAGALLLVRAEGVEQLAEVLDQDPFWVQGLVVRRTARRWDPVIGPWSH